MLIALRRLCRAGRAISFGLSSFALQLLLLAAGSCVAHETSSSIASEQVLTPVLVSASCFAECVDSAPVGAIVISAEQIRESGADNINQAIRSIAGVAGRQNSYGSSDFSLDLRGFGASAERNMVILIDGVRLSENESSVALLSSIPIETVERIEIVRGGSSVLYGEGATAGTIQIITRRAQHQEGIEGSRSRGTVVADAGSFGQRGLRVALVREQQGWSLDTNIVRRETDNYRDNNRLRQENVSGGLQWADDNRRIGLRIDRLDQHYRTAGALTMAQTLDNPRSSFTPDDYGATGMTRAVLSAEQRMGAFDLAAQLSQRDKTYSSHTVGSFGISDYATRSRTTQLSPRLRYTADTGKWHNELVTGFDVSESARQAVSASSLAAGVQRSRALYARNEIRRGGGGARLAFGMRREIFDQRSTDPLAWNQNNNYAQSQALTARDVAGSVAPLPRTTLFAKAGRSYRVANIDENGFTLPPGQILRAQTSDDLAFGATLGTSASRHALTLTLFQHHLRNEIMYDPTIANPATGGNGANVNLDPTLRRGVELEMRSQLTASFALSASFQHVDAGFRRGGECG